MRRGIALLVLGVALATSGLLPRSALVPNAIAFTTPTRGLLATGELGCSDPTAHCRLGGTIQRTTDGGRTWHIVLRTSRPVASVSIDAAGAWARIDDGKTLHSGNDGKTWAPAVPETSPASPCPPALDIYVHQLVVTRHHEWALCAGEGSAGQMRKAVYRLQAEGWRRVDHGLSSFGYPVGMAMADNGFGLIWESRGTLYVTRDGGSHWIGRPHVAAPEIDFGVSGVALPHGVGFVVLMRARFRQRLLETTDAGRTWRVVHRWR